MNERPDEPAGRLDAALARLPKGIEPSRDLWPAIEARLESRSVRRRQDWRWLAAAGVLVAIGSSMITAILLRDDRPEPAQLAAAVEAAVEEAPVIPAAFGPGGRMGPGYLATRRVLLRELESRIDRLPPEAQKSLERNLAELHRASAEINAALALKPGDPLLEELLLNTYQDELAVLASVNHLAGGNGAGPTNDPTRMQPL
jgi:hypothetical protein